MKSPMEYGRDRYDGDDPRDRKESSGTNDPDKQRRKNGAG